MILDANGKKMSKSKGNGIDPLDVIAEYGSDALRLSLMIGNTPGKIGAYTKDFERNNLVCRETRAAIPPPAAPPPTYPNHALLAAPQSFCQGSNTSQSGAC